MLNLPEFIEVDILQQVYDELNVKFFGGEL